MSTWAELCAESRASASHLDECIEKLYQQPRTIPLEDLDSCYWPEADTGWRNLCVGADGVSTIRDSGNRMRILGSDMGRDGGEE